MISNLNLKINNAGPIHEANIDIGKINVIGGPNATGKSTASKLLYCFLKGGVINRQEFAYTLIEREIYHLISYTDENRHVRGRRDIRKLIDDYYEAKDILLNSNQSDFSKKSITSLITN